MKKLKLAFEDIHDEYVLEKTHSNPNEVYKPFSKTKPFKVTSLETLPKNFTLAELFILPDLRWRNSDSLLFYGDVNEFTITNETRDEEVEVLSHALLEKRFKLALAENFDIDNYDVSVLEKYVIMSPGMVHSFASDMAQSVYDESPSRDEIKDYLNLSDREYEEGDSDFFRD